MAEQNELRSAAVPVAPVDRIGAIDTLRGVALLGILVMNIPFFALSYYGFMRPEVTGGFEGLDYAAWLGSHLLFDQKMMSIFSMLFGAGFLLLAGRSEARGQSAAGIYYRRVGWLALIGLCHAYFLWFGDILFTYALCGLLLYPLRRLPAVWLAVIGVVVMLVGVLTSAALGGMFIWLRESMPDEFAEAMKDFNPTAEMLDDERAAMLGSYTGYFFHNVAHAIELQTLMFALWGLWRVTGLMMLGMALMKWGVVTASRTPRFYAILAAAGFGAGLPLVWLGSQRLVASDFDVIDMLLVNWHFNYVGSVLIALGWIGMVMLVCKLGALKLLTGALGAVGRMALSNYLAQSLICTTIFCGWGFGWWGELSRSQLIIFVVCVWAAQLIWSPLWLSRFRFGPAEWVWRTLTYWKKQPMLVAA